MTNGIQQTDVVTSGSALARRLGVSRQVVSYHSGRSEAPKVLSVSAWKKYLSVFGRTPMATTPKPVAMRLDFEDGILNATETFSNGLRSALASALEAAGVKLSSDKTDRMAIDIFIECGNHVQRVARKWHCTSGPMSALGGEYFWPEEIEEAAARIGFDLTAAAT